MRSSKRFVLMFMLATAMAAFAADGSTLKPLAGASVAVVVFEDLECPACAQAFPILVQAAKDHNVPLVLHDVPNVRLHPWTWDATLTARYIEQKFGRAMSDRYRAYIFDCQPKITKGNLRSYIDTFCKDNKILLPFVIDRDGKLAEAIRADVSLAQQVSISVTPTIFVVGANNWRELNNYQLELYPTIEKMQRDAPAPQSPKAAPGKKASSKRS